MKKTKSAKTIRIVTPKRLEREIRCEVLAILDRFGEKLICLPSGFDNVFYTMGVRVMCSLCQVEWLLIEMLQVGNYWYLRDRSRLIIITFSKSSRTVVYMNEERQVLRQFNPPPVSMVSFPLKEVTLYYVEGILMLSSEY